MVQALQAQERRHHSGGGLLHEALTCFDRALRALGPAEDPEGLELVSRPGFVLRIIVSVNGGALKQLYLAVVSPCPGGSVSASYSTGGAS
jgi:hypothetical protein